MLFQQLLLFGKNKFYRLELFMSVRTISASEFLSSLFSNFHEPFVVHNFSSLLPEFEKLRESLRLDNLLEKTRNISDSIGFVVERRSVEEVSISTALSTLVSGADGYINGWEYMASDCCVLPQSLGLDEYIFSRNNFLKILDLPSANLLDTVMRWIFISRGSGSYSGWHKDPIGSAAWMLMIEGSKIWSFPNNSQIKISVGDLIVIPPGIEHKVTNIGDSVNVAISHNWIPIQDTTLMWKELFRGLSELKKFHIAKIDSEDSTNILNQFHETNDSVDNLLFGLIMVFLHMDLGKRENVLVEYCLNDHVRNEIRDLLNELDYLT